MLDYGVASPGVYYCWSSGERQNMALSSFTTSNLDPESAMQYVGVWRVVYAIRILPELKKTEFVLKDSTYTPQQN